MAWPQRRSGHTAICLGFNDPRSRLLVIGGCDHLGKALDDMWLMDPRTGECENVRIPNYKFPHCKLPFSVTDTKTFQCFNELQSKTV